MRSEFRELRAYQLPVSLANELRREIGRWPSLDQWSLGVQLLRAIDSVGANIAEGAGRWHRQDQRRFLLMARGSLYETEHWLASAQDRDLLDHTWLDRLEEAARALSGLIKRWPPG